jgi:FAD/FMN-containing dehydrogenase
MVITSVWTNPATTDANIAWTRESFAAVRSHLAERRWLNYLDDDDAADAVRAAYGPNYARLAEVKRGYDPDNLFRLNHNIEPAEG